MVIHVAPAFWAVFLQFPEGPSTQQHIYIYTRGDLVYVGS